MSKAYYFAVIFIFSVPLNSWTAVSRRPKVYTIFTDVDTHYVTFAFDPLTLNVWSVSSVLLSN